MAAFGSSQAFKNKLIIGLGIKAPLSGVKQPLLLIYPRTSDEVQFLELIDFHFLKLPVGP